MDRPIYLDHNATTPLAPGVLDVMTRYLGEEFGNPSSAHAYGDTPRQAIATARARLATLLGASPSELVFTGCGTESNALALMGIATDRAGHVITQATEHPAVLENCRALAAQGVRITVLPVDSNGLVDPGELKEALTPATLLVSVMYANNETGTIQPIAELAGLAHQAGALFHTDAAQAVGKIPLSVDELDVDLLTVAAHKFGGPKGVGALYVRDGVTVRPIVRGGGQEHGLRSGTENVSGIAGLGVAAEVAAATVVEQRARLVGLRDELLQLLVFNFGERVLLNGHPQLRLPNTLNVGFAGAVGAEVLAAVPEIAASTGSACHDGSIGSPVLAAMGLDADRAAGAIRLSLGRTTTEDDIRTTAGLLTNAVRAIGSHGG
ncbi:MAG TPA: cysteine desulfurase family protein [Micromonosporaceae bacterium]|jgi:cysteine desulfurase